MQCTHDTERLKILKGRFGGTSVPEALTDYVTEQVAARCAGVFRCQFTVDRATFPVLADAAEDTHAIQLSIISVCLQLPSIKLDELQTSARSVAPPALDSLQRGWVVTRQTEHPSESESLLNEQIHGQKRVIPSPRQRFEALAKEFLVLPGIGASCVNSLFPSKSSSTNSPKSLEDAENMCLNQSACTFIIQDLHLTMCTDSSISSARKSPAAITLVKGSQVIEDVPLDSHYYIYLNQQGICEDSSVVKKQENVRSVKDAVLLCTNTPHCSYFIMTTEAGLTTAEDEPGVMPNYLWLCNEPEKQAQREEERPAVHLTAVYARSVISGYSVNAINRYGEPIIVAAPF